VKHLLNVPSFGFDDGPQSRSPLVNGTVDQSLVQFTPAMPDLLLQVIVAGDAVPLKHLLQRTPHRIVHRVEIRAVGWPQCWFDEVWNIALQKFDRQLSAQCITEVIVFLSKIGIFSNQEIVNFCSVEVICHFVCNWQQFKIVNKWYLFFK